MTRIDHELAILKNCPKPSLNQILLARENRALKQKKLLLKAPCLVCLTMNIAGEYKISPLIEQGFCEGISQIKQMLALYHIKVSQEVIDYLPYGHEAYFAVEGLAPLIKDLMLKIEDNTELGRLFDIDVLDSSGQKIARSAQNKRKCLLCEDNPFICRRTFKHTVEQLQIKTITILISYFDRQFIDDICAKANRALLYELAVSPKPGLVDRFDTGAHNDMDFFTFIDSISLLSGYLTKVMNLALANYDLEPPLLLKQLRYLGLKAEQDMYTLTKGINTHKGAIFGLGIISACLAVLYGRGQAININTICDLAQQMASEILADFEQNTLKQQPLSNGEQLYNQCQIYGARGEAYQGFSTVRDIAYPKFCALINSGYSLNQAAAITLVHLISHTQDSNIIKRSNQQTLAQIQNQLQDILDDDNLILANLAALNQQFINLNISPGGSADLLAITLFIWLIEN